MLISKRQKVFDTFDKLFFLCFTKIPITIKRIKPCLLPIQVFALIAIFHSCFVETTFAIEWESRSKLQTGTLNDRNSISYSCVKFWLPETIDRENSLKFRKNDTPKSVSSGIKSCFLVSSISDVSTKNSDKYAANNFIEVVYAKIDQWIHSPFDWFWWLVILPLALMPIWIAWIFPRFYSS